MRGLLADLRHALRHYARTPVPSAIAVVVLAVAMACVSAFLSLFNDLVLEPHPGFEQSGELISIGQTDGSRFMALSLELIERIGEEASSVAAISGVGAVLLDVEPGDDRRVVELAAGSFFTDLRPRLELGRGFTPREHEADGEPVAVISYGYWQQQLGGRPDALGETVRVTGRPQIIPLNPDGPPEIPDERTIEYRVVGVMAPEFATTFGAEAAMWLPYEQAAPQFLGAGDVTRRSTTIWAIARLSPTASPATVAAELNDRYGDDAGPELNIAPGAQLDAHPGVVRNIRQQREAERQVRLFLAGSVLLALVAACNVSLFLLSRAPGRRRELGIRMAVGAPWRRLARQLATEAGLLVVTATALGVLISLWLAVAVQDLAFLQGAQWHSVSPLDWRVLAIVGVMLLILTALVALAPVLGLKRLGIAASSRSITARPGAAQRLAGTVQIAIAGALGGAALAFGWYLAALVTADPGYDAADLHVVSVVGPQGAERFGLDDETTFVERERHTQAIAGQPGIEDVAFGGAVPGLTSRALFARLPRQDGAEGTAEFQAVSGTHSFTALLGLRLIDGRRPEPSERYALLVNESAARELWGRVDVVGEALQLPAAGPGGAEVVGVLADVPFGHPSEEAEPIAFIPTSPLSPYDHALIRSSASTAEVRAIVQRLIDAGDIDLEIQDVVRLDDLVADLLAADRARSLLTVACAALVVLLAGFGFYGTQRYLVTAGRREYAIRAALGAGPRALGRIVLGRGLRLALPGWVLGTLLAFVLVAWLRDDFVSRAVSPHFTALIVAAGIGALLLAAGAGPARQARKTRPAPLLREE